MTLVLKTDLGALTWKVPFNNINKTQTAKFTDLMMFLENTLPSTITCTYNMNIRLKLLLFCIFKTVKINL